MTWVKLDDEFYEHDKVAGLTDRAFRLHVSALCLCGRLLTDGNVRPNHLRQLGGALSMRNIHKVVDELIAARLWYTKPDGSHAINDYLSYNPSSVRVKEERLRKARNQQSYRDRYRQRSVSRTPTPINKELLPTDDNQPQTAEVLQLVQKTADGMGSIP